MMLLSKCTGWECEEPIKSPNRSARRLSKLNLQLRGETWTPRKWKKSRFRTGPGTSSEGQSIRSLETSCTFKLVEIKDGKKRGREEFSTPFHFNKHLEDEAAKGKMNGDHKSTQAKIFCEPLSSKNIVVPGAYPNHKLTEDHRFSLKLKIILEVSKVCWWFTSKIYRVLDGEGCVCHSQLWKFQRLAIYQQRQTRRNCWWSSRWTILHCRQFEHLFHRAQISGCVSYLWSLLVEGRMENQQMVKIVWINLQHNKTASAAFCQYFFSTVNSFLAQAWRECVKWFLS